MNRKFKVIWSKVRNCYIVTNELVKRSTKSTKSNFISRTVITGILTCVFSYGFTVPALAGGSAYDIDTDINYYEAESSQGVTLGKGKLIKTYDSNNNRYTPEHSNAAVDDTLSGIAIGYSGYDSISRAPSEENFVPSYHTPTAAASGAISIGNEAFAGGTFSVVLGNNTQSWSNRGIAIGHGVSVGNNTQGTVAIGAELNIADGVTNSVVLGNGSNTNQSNVLSIGNDAVKRKIVNMASGTSASDAATVGQIQTITAGTNVTINTTANANGSTNKQIIVNGTGTVTKNDTGLINGGTAYEELRPNNGNYVNLNCKIS